MPRVKNKLVCEICGAIPNYDLLNISRPRDLILFIIMDRIAVSKIAIQTYESNMLDQTIVRHYRYKGKLIHAEWHGNHKLELGVEDFPRILEFENEIDGFDQELAGLIEYFLSFNKKSEVETVKLFKEEAFALLKKSGIDIDEYLCVCNNCGLTRFIPLKSLTISNHSHNHVFNIHGNKIIPICDAWKYTSHAEHPQVYAACKALEAIRDYEMSDQNTDLKKVQFKLIVGRIELMRINSLIDVFEILPRGEGERIQQPVTLLSLLIPKMEANRRSQQLGAEEMLKTENRKVKIIKLAEEAVLAGKHKFKTVGQVAKNISDNKEYGFSYDVCLDILKSAHEKGRFDLSQPLGLPNKSVGEMKI